MWYKEFIIKTNPNTKPNLTLTLKTNPNPIPNLNP